MLDTEENPAALWAEIHRLRAEIEGPKPYATWKDCAIDQRLKLIALQEAARIVVNRWDGPTWKDLEPTALVINKMRALLPSAPDKPVGTDK